MATHNLHGSALVLYFLSTGTYHVQNHETYRALCSPGNTCEQARRLSNTCRYRNPNCTEHLTNDAGDTSHVYMDYSLPVGNCRCKGFVVVALLPFRSGFVTQLWMVVSLPCFVLREYRPGFWWYMDMSKHDGHTCTMSVIQTSLTNSGDTRSCSTA
jgi:hypothetical protein